MKYIFREKLSLVTETGVASSVVFVVEPEEYLLDLYCKYLLEGKYVVKGFRDLDMLVIPKEAAHEPDVAVINTHFLERPDFSVYRSRIFPDWTKIISIGSLSDTKFMGNLMSLGVSSHLERRLSRPSDLVEIVRTLIYH